MELRRRLGNQAAFEHDLETEFRRQVTKAEKLRRRGWSFPILFEAQASKLLSRQRWLLTKWLRYVNHLRPLAGLPQPPWSVAVMGGWLAHSLSVLRRKTQAAEMLRDFRDLDAAIMALIDLPEMRTQIYVGPCPNKWPNQETTEHCPGQVEAYVPADENAPAYLHCGACDAQWPSWQWSRAGHEINKRAAELETQRRLAREVAKVGELRIAAPTTTAAGA